MPRNVRRPFSPYPSPYSPHPSANPTPLPLPIPSFNLLTLPPVGQLPQTSYHSLQTPYSFFGLGRTNNYIENLFVGATIHAPEHFINMEGVVPNSKVVIHPSAREGEAWRRELYLRPGKWIP